MVSPRKKRNKELKDYVTTLDEAKSVHRHETLMSVVRRLTTVISLTFLSIVALYLFMSVKNNQIPSLDSVVVLFGNLSSILNIALGIES